MNHEDFDYNKSKKYKNTFKAKNNNSLDTIKFEVKEHVKVNVLSPALSDFLFH